MTIGIRVGDELPEWRLEHVSAEKMKLFAAILRDPNPIHFDRSEVEKRTGSRRLINQGPINVGYVANMLVAWGGPRSLRRLNVRFTDNVFDGDTVTAKAKVTKVQLTAAGEAVVDCAVWLETSQGTRALSGEATVAIENSAR